MREDYGSCYVCQGVCYQSSCCIPHFWVETEVSLGFSLRFLQMKCVDFLKMFCSKVMVTFADHLGLLHFLTDSRCTKETMMASFLLK